VAAWRERTATVATLVAAADETRRRVLATSCDISTVTLNACPALDVNSPTVQTTQ